MNKNLQPRSDRYRKLLSFARIGWWEANITTRQYSFTEELGELLGFRDNKMSFEEFHGFVHEAYRDQVCHGIDTLLESDGFALRFPLCLPRRGELWVDLRLDVTEINEQQQFSAWGYLQIMDERVEDRVFQQAEMSVVAAHMLVSDEVYIHNAKLLSGIYNKLPVGVELYDKSGVLVDINDRGIEIFGLGSREKNLGQNLFENPNMPKEVIESLKQGKDINFRMKYNFSLLKDYNSTNYSGFKDIAVKVTVLRDADGQIESYLFITIDDSGNELALSKIRDFESVFQIISEYAKVGYAKLNMLTKTGYALGQWFRNYGENDTTDVCEVIGVYSKMHPDDRKQVLEFYEAVVTGKRRDYRGEVRILQPDGSWKWTLSNIIVSEYKPEFGEIELIGVNYDISDLKKFENELMMAKDKAETMDHLKSAFLANMSHEIRTPLNAIVGFSRLMNENLEEEERVRYIEIVEENNELLLQLISDILDLSKIEAGMFDFVYGDVDVNQFCRELIDGMQIKVPQGVELIFEKHSDDCHLVSDRHRLYQVLSNFINNALKFTSVGTIVVGYVEREGELKFYVKDTGNGIPKDKLPSVFERFVKLNHMAQGSGLGLAICKSIVDQFGGQIGVESNEGVGSLFWFTHPLRPIGCVNFNDREILQPRGGITVDKTGKIPVILIAEDTDSNYLLLMAILKKEYELHWAKDGMEAVEMCRDLSPDLVLMDIRMPRLDGLEATRQIRKFNSDVPILAITAFAFDLDRQRALEAGCNAFITKPVSTIELKTAMNDWLFR